VVGFPPQRAYVQRPPTRSHQRNTLVTKAQAPTAGQTTGSTLSRIVRRISCGRVATESSPNSFTFCLPSIPLGNVIIGTEAGPLISLRYGYD
jgi:hypothetical protein